MITTWILILVSTGDIVGQYYTLRDCVSHMPQYDEKTMCARITHGRDKK